MESKPMPKKIDAAKSKMRSKSTRKPLREVSNVKITVRSANNLKKKISEEDCGQTGGDSLDRLLLVHSDISSFLLQIDELVVQALQLTGDEGKKEIKRFADLLSDMRTSLKPWVPKFQKAISRGSDKNKLEQSIEKTVICNPKESTDAVIESPENQKLGSLISPSPLVSWRPEWNTEGGRQLFLLTPLPQIKMKTFSSKLQASSFPALENTAFDETAHTGPLSNSMGNLASNPPEIVSAKPPANKVVGTLDTICASPPANSSKMNCCMYVMTPCLKMSPPKSCILLEPVSVFSKKKNPGAHKSTPYPAVVQNSDSQDSDSSSSNQSSDDLKVRYPELYGINMNNLGNKKVPEDSPSWIVSPPKSCVIMEPLDEKLMNNRHGNFLPARTTPVLNQKNRDVCAALDLVESTPMIVKEPASNSRMGKHPGENTLKRELWTKFEEASSDDIFCFDPPVGHTSTKKGFLDQLEEASNA